MSSGREHEAAQRQASHAPYRQRVQQKARWSPVLADEICTAVQLSCSVIQAVVT
jgi:hypothetical protein